MSTLTFKLPERLRRKIERLAKKSGTTKSAWLREAVESRLESSSPAVHRSRAPATLLAALADGVGACDSGIGDLASNKKHLAGYGK